MSDLGKVVKTFMYEGASYNSHAGVGGIRFFMNLDENEILLVKEDDTVIAIISSEGSEDTRYLEVRI